MTDFELIHSLGDREYAVPLRLWAYAHIVGDARRLTHEGRRKPQKDLGSLNYQSDVKGAFSELFLYWLLRNRASNGLVDGIRQQMYSASGGILAADIVCDSGQKFDIKSNDCEPRSSLFIINSQKHRDAVGRYGFYIAVLCPMLGRRAILTKPIPFDDVSGWGEKTLGSYNDPARFLRIGDFVSKYAPASSGGFRGYHKDKFNLKEMLTSSNDPQVRNNLMLNFPALRPVLQAV
jgi:hypothetical protein